MFYTQGAKYILSYWHSQPKCDAGIAFTLISCVVQSTTSMLKLEDLGACPRKILKITSSDIDFGSILCNK